MRLRYKILTVFIIIFVVLSGVTLYVLGKNEAKIKNEIISVVQQKTGRNLAIGSLHFWFLPLPIIEAENVAFSGLEGETNNLATIEKIRVAVEVVPLFSHQINIKKLTLIKPDIHLLRNDKGEENWLIKNMKINYAVFCENLCSGHADWHISLPNVTMRDAFIHWQDDVTRSQWDASFPKISVQDLNKRQASVYMEGNYKEKTLFIAGKLGQVYPFAQHFPVDLDLLVKQNDTSLVSGHIDGGIADIRYNGFYNFNISSHVPNLARLKVALPSVTLPQSQPISITTNISGHRHDLMVNNFHLHGGGVDLSPWMEHSNVRVLTIDSDGSDKPLQIFSDGHFGQDGFETKGYFGTLQIFSKDKLKENIPVNLAIKEGESSIILKGDVGTEHSSLKLTGGLKHLPLKEASSEINGFHVNLNTDIGRVRDLIGHNMMLSVLRSLNVSGSSHIDNISWQGARWEDIHSDIQSHHGHIAIAPITLHGDHQDQKLALTYDVQRETPEMTFGAHPFFVPLPAIRNMLHITPNIVGRLQIVGDMHSQGHNSREISDRLGGHIGFSIVNGSVNRDFLINILKTNLASFNVTIPATCMGAHMSIRNGISHIDDMGMQVLSLRLQGRGQVNLTSRLLNLQLQSQLDLFGKQSLPTRVHLTGNWEEPGVELMDVPDENSISQLDTPAYCATLLRTTREGEAGPKPFIVKTNNKDNVNKAVAKEFGVKQSDVENGEKALGIHLDFLDGDKTSSSKK